MILGRNTTKVTCPHYIISEGTWCQCLTTGNVNLEQLVQGCLPGVSTIQLVFFSFLLYLLDEGLNPATLTERKIKVSFLEGEVSKNLWTYSTTGTNKYLRKIFWKYTLFCLRPSPTTFSILWWILPSTIVTVMFSWWFSISFFCSTLIVGILMKEELSHPPPHLLI